MRFKTTPRQMIHALRMGCMAIGYLLVTPASAQLTTVVFQPGSAGVDALTSSTATAVNYSLSTTLEASGNPSAIKKRAQILFDLSTLPPQALVYSAKLSLYGVAHSGTANACYLAKNTSSWTESSVTWATMPSTTSTGQLSLTQSTAAAQVYTLDVKAFVQDMISIPAANFGWTLVKQNELTLGALVFASSDNANQQIRPKLEISYCLPVSLLPYMAPSSSTVSANGALYVNVSGGVAPYTYAWSDGSTGRDLLNKLPGVYSFTVTDNVGNKTKKDYLISAEEATMTFTLVPDALSGTDGLIQLGDDGSLANINYSNHAQYKAERGTAGTWFATRTLFSFDFSCIPSNAVVTSAFVTLYGNGHNPLNQPNSAKLYVNTGSWREQTLTWNTQPTHSTSNPVVIAPTSTSTDNRTLDISLHVQSWIRNPASNYGWKMMLDDEVSSLYSFLVFGSSDALTSIRPTLVLTITVPRPTQYAILRKKLDGNYYQTAYGVLAFKLDEEYAGNGVGLDYKIYDYNRNVVLSNVSPGATIIPNYKDNRISLSLLSLNPSLSGWYVLEVKDKKGAVSMLRFKI
jgi:hypothetical protein